MMRLQRIAAAAACALLLGVPANAQLIGSGHVMGNGTSSSAAPTDIPLVNILNQSGSGITKAGNTNKLATVNGTIANGHCRSTDSDGNDIDAGGTCSVGGGGGTVTSSSAGQLAVYPTTGNTVSGVSSLPSLTINASGLGFGLDTNYTATGTTPNPDNFNLMLINDSAVVGGPNFGVGLAVQDNMNSTSIQGGRNALSGSIIQTAATSGSNVNRNYTGTFGQCFNSSGDGGTNPTTGALGGCFGLNGIGLLETGAQDMLTIAGAEIDVGMQSGTSSRNKFGLFITDLEADAVNASVNDAALGISSQGSVGFNIGVDFTDAAEKFGVNSTGTLILSSPAAPATVARGIYFHNMTFTNNVIETPNFIVDPNGNVTAASVKLGTITFSSLPTCTSGNEGLEYALQNSNTTAFNTAITSAGAFHVIAYCNGTGWAVH